MSTRGLRSIPRSSSIESGDTIDEQPASNLGTEGDQMEGDDEEVLMSSDQERDIQRRFIQTVKSARSPSKSPYVPRSYRFEEEERPDRR